MNNQHMQIMGYLERHGSITPMEAFENLHITKLSTRIGEMVREGAPIARAMQNVKKADGSSVRYMKYFLAEFKEEN